MRACDTAGFLAVSCDEHIKSDIMCCHFGVFIARTSVLKQHRKVMP